MTSITKLLVATNNKGKLREYVQLLGKIPFELVTLAEAGITTEVQETGLTMEENAIQKASEYSKLVGLIIMTDDSGLEIDVLNGEPGVMSRRYAGENASNSERNEYLLSKLRDVPLEKRTARFRCVIAIASSEGKVETCEGICEGIIALEPKGDNGFGYDPIFHMPDLGKRMAELSLEEKNEVSHRAKAARKAKLILENLG